MLGAGATDNLTGSSQNDLLVGLGGDDILAGGGGDDVLAGGAGFDTYYYRIGDGDDKIVDSDKRGRMVVAAAAGDRFYNATHLIRDQDNPDLWINADGQVRLTHGGTWQLQIGGGSIDLGADFTDGDYGIRLKNALPQVAPSNIFLGDQNADKNDSLFGSAGRDRIEGLSGDDRLDGQGGDDLLLGGAGDLLVGDGMTSAVHAFRCIDLSSCRRYAAGMPIQTRRQADNDRGRRAA
jgi:Ca2+-binding RTX toxin-like protein